jgi:hypothetical protein
MPVWLIYPNRRHLPRRVRVFMTWIETLMQARLDGPPGDPAEPPAFTPAA